jgi:hypothetical protein
VDEVMPRFYFDIREGSRFVLEEEGIKFPDLDAAEQEAAIAAAEIARSRLARGDARFVTIEVRNEHGQRVLTVRVTMEIDRVIPPPVSLGDS